MCIHGENIFLKRDFDPNKKNGNHLSVAKGLLYYKSSLLKPSSLKKVRDSAQFVINQHIPTDQAEANQIKNNINILNGKIDNYNHSFLGKVVLIVSKIAKAFFLKRLGNWIKNRHHVDKIEIPIWYNEVEKYNEKAKQIAKDMELYYSQNVALQIFKTIKISDEDPKTKDSTIDNPDTSGTTVINNEEGTFIVKPEEVNEIPISNPQQSGSVKPLPQDPKNKRKVNLSKLTPQDVNIPKWAEEFANHKGPAPGSKATIVPNLYIETIESGKPILMPPLDDMNWEKFENSQKFKNINLKGSSIQRLNWEIVSNVKCFAGENNNHFIKNYSHVPMYMRTPENEYHEIAPHDNSIPMKTKGTYLFWLDDQEKTGFIITRR